ncbi:hypothetical protein B0H19DRAFT_1197625 [Mycena capillaripes]|nr:hypothetical protein B0H19DRAFT_1197625 [Mycena capillaripes]
MPTALVGFPFDLPLPAPPATPRTTHQQMLRNGMSEGLRHNLLRQRKLSQKDKIGAHPRRTNRTVNVPSAQQQAEKSLVRVMLRVPGAERREMLLPMKPPVQGVAPTKKKLVRNIGWAHHFSFHQTGW